MKITKKYLNDLTYKIIGCAIEVHKHLGSFPAPKSPKGDFGHTLNYHYRKIVSKGVCKNQVGVHIKKAASRGESAKKGFLLKFN